MISPARSPICAGLLLSITLALCSGDAARAATTLVEDQAVQTPGAAASGAPAPVADDSRYSFHRMGDGFIRLDSRTGELAQCGWATAGWSCRTVPDERAALDQEIGRLQRENGALKKALLSHGIDLPAGIVAAAPGQSGPVPPNTVPDASRDARPNGPGDADLDRALAFVKNVWRKLVDMMNDLQRDIQKKS